jgi:phage host-nuclease inhibitor protein Gam
MDTLDFEVKINLDVELTKEDILANLEHNTGIKDIIISKALEDLNVTHDYVNVE